MATWDFWSVLFYLFLSDNILIGTLKSIPKGS